MISILKRAVRDQPLLRAGALSAGAFLRSMERAPPGVYTLCYHHVRQSAQANFAAQLDYLKCFGVFVDADQAVCRLLDGHGDEERAFVLTFDDGYRDNVEVALPVIEAAAVPAQVFLVSDWLRAPPADGQVYMGEADVRRWRAAGLTIGSHGATHRRFSGLTRQQAADELKRSAETLAALQGRPVTHFACPWGVAHHDFLPERDVELARAAGYTTFFTTRRGRARHAGDVLSMPRHVLEPEWPVHHLASLMGESRFA